MLYVVATPVGNLGDITLRALEVLKVLTLWRGRHAVFRLTAKHFEIKKPFVSYHEHNEAARTAELVDRLARGENVRVDYRRWHAWSFRSRAAPDSRMHQSRTSVYDRARTIGDSDRAGRFRVFDREVFVPRISSVKSGRRDREIADSS